MFDSNIYKQNNNYLVIKELENFVQLVHKKSRVEIVVIMNKGEVPEVSLGVKTPVFNNKGTSHSVEHMILGQYEKNSNRSIQSLICELGGSFQGYTGLDRTVFSFFCSNQRNFLRILDIGVSAILNPLFEQRVFNYEIYRLNSDKKNAGAIIREMTYEWTKKNRWDEYQVLNSLFNCGSNIFPRGGFPKDILLLTLEDIQEYYNTFFYGDNIKIIMKIPSFKVEYLDVLNVYLGKIVYKINHPNVKFENQRMQAKNLIYPKQMRTITAAICKLEKPKNYGIEFLFSRILKKSLLYFDTIGVINKNWKINITLHPYYIFGLGLINSKYSFEVEKYLRNKIDILINNIQYQINTYKDLEFTLDFPKLTCIMDAWLRGCDPLKYLEKPLKVDILNYSNNFINNIRCFSMFVHMRNGYSIKRIFDEFPKPSYAFCNKSENIILRDIFFNKQNYDEYFNYKNPLGNKLSRYKGLFKFINYQSTQSKKNIKIYIEYKIRCELDMLILTLIKYFSSFLGLFASDVELFATRFYGESFGLLLNYTYEFNDKISEEINYDLFLLNYDLRVIAKLIITNEKNIFFPSTSIINCLIDRCASSLCSYGRFLGIKSDLTFISMCNDFKCGKYNINYNLFGEIWGIYVSDTNLLENEPSIEKYFGFMNHPLREYDLNHIKKSQRYGDYLNIGHVAVGYSWKENSIIATASWFFISELFTRENMRIINRTFGTAYSSFSIFNPIDRLFFLCTKSDINPELTIKKFKNLNSLVREFFYIQNESVNSIINNLINKLNNDIFEKENKDLFIIVKSNLYILWKKNIIYELKKMYNLDDIIEIAIDSIENISDIIIGI